LREALDPIEAIGVSRALDRARAADLRVFLTGRGEVPLLVPEPGDLVVQAKADLVPGAVGLAVSGVTGEGVERLIKAVTSELAGRALTAGVMTRARHREAMARAALSLVAAQRELRLGPERAEFASEEIGRALRALSSLVGSVDVEHLLDEIFASFCIGK
jgi:tRNA modification GTPase